MTEVEETLSEREELGRAASRETWDYFCKWAALIDHVVIPVDELSDTERSLYAMAYALAGIERQLERIALVLNAPVDPETV